MVQRDSSNLPVDANSEEQATTSHDLRLVFLSVWEGGGGLKHLVCAVWVGIRWYSEARIIILNEDLQ